MVLTLSVRQCCSSFVAWSVRPHYAKFEGYLSTQYTLVCSELEDGLHTKYRTLRELRCCCSAFVSLLCFLDCHTTLCSLCRLSTNLVHIHL